MNYVNSWMNFCVNRPDELLHQWDRLTAASTGWIKRRQRRRGERKRSWWYLSAPLLLGLGDDLVVGVAHHGDEHVQQQDGHQDHEDGKHNLRQRGVPRVVEHLILYTHTMPHSVPAIPASHHLEMLQTIWDKYQQKSKCLYV